MDNKYNDEDFVDKDFFDEIFDVPNWGYVALLLILAIVAAVAVIGHFMG